MARKTITELTNQTNSSLPDNAVGLITPAVLRTLILDFLDTVTPAYANIVLTSGIGIPMTTSYTTISWSSILILTDIYTVSLASGLVTRIAGPGVARVSFSIDVMAPSNSVTTFALFVDGIETAWATSNTSSNSSGYQSYAFTAVVGSTNTNPTYQIRAKSSGTNNVSLTSGILVVENIWIGTGTV